MNKLISFFNIPLIKYDILNEYPFFDEIKRVLEAYLVNYLDISKKLIVEKLITASINVNITQPSSNKKRKRNKKKDKDKRKSFLLEKPEYPYYKKRHGGIY
jgi:chitinase